MPQALKVTDFSLYFHIQEEKNSDNKNKVSLARADEGLSGKRQRWAAVGIYRRCAGSASPPQTSQQLTPGYGLF